MLKKLKKSLRPREILCFIRGVNEKGKSEIIGIKILLALDDTPPGKYIM